MALLEQVAEPRDEGEPYQPHQRPDHRGLHPTSPPQPQDSLCEGGHFRLPQPPGGARHGRSPRYHRCSPRLPAVLRAGESPSLLRKGRVHGVHQRPRPVDQGPATRVQWTREYSLAPVASGGR